MNTNKRALRNVGMVWLAIGFALIAANSATGWLFCILGLSYLVEITAPSEVGKSPRRYVG